MTKKEPRPHQTEAIIKGVKYFTSNDRGKMIMACGTGKTLTSLWIAESLNATNIIVALPSLQLQSQTIGTWIDEARQLNYEMLAVGSDKSVKSKYGVNATTKSDEIAAFLSNPLPKIIFSTYQSSDVLIKACKITNTIFDFGVIDEAHNTTGSDRKIFAKILKDENGIIVKKRLFMTATPIIFDHDEAISMDDEDIYGKEFYNLTIRDGINQGILTDYKILVIWLNHKIVQDYAMSNSFLTYEGIKTNSKYLVIKEFLEKAIIKYNLKKIISFHNSRENAKKFSHLLNQGNTVKSYNIDSKSKLDQRSQIINSFVSSEISCITNPRIMIEGFDLPMIDSVIFSDIKSSGTEIIQAMGRALRKYPKKEKSYILFPIIVDDNGVINVKEYQKVSNILGNTILSDKKLYKSYDKNNTKKISESNEDNENFEQISFGDFDLNLLETIKKNLSIRVWNLANGIINKFVSFEIFKKEIKEIAKTHTINNSKKFYKWATGKEDFGIPFPNNFPKSPNTTYHEWTTWNNVFYEGEKEFVDYEMFRKEMQFIAIKYGIDNYPKFLEWKGNKKDFGIPFPKNFPKKPENKYESEWKGWKEIFDKKGYECVSYESFKIKLCSISESYGIDNYPKFLEWKSNKKDFGIPYPDDFPKKPENKYKNEWKGWNEIFDRRYKWVEYEIFKNTLKKLAISHDVSSSTKYGDWARGKKDFGIPFPNNFPKTPHLAYKSEWKNWEEIFDNKKIWVEYEFFKNTLKKLAISHDISSSTKYEDWADNKKDFGILFPNDFPKSPRMVYKTEWKGWNEIYGNIKKVVDYVSFKNELKILAKKHNIKSGKDFYDWAENKKFFGVSFPDDFPKQPPKAYKKEWEGWGKFFGKRYNLIDYETFKSKLQFMAELQGINNSLKYNDWSTGKRDFGVSFPDDFPKQPPKAYKKEWEGWKVIFR